MISYVKEYTNIDKGKESLPINNDEGYYAFAKSYTPLLDSQCSLSPSDLKNYLCAEGSIDLDNIFCLADFFMSFNPQEVISRSHISGDKYQVEDELLYNEYELINKESHMRFPYTLDFYGSSRSYQSFFSKIRDISSDLNYIAFVCNTKSEIDDILKKSIDSLHYELTFSKYNYEIDNNEGITTEEWISRYVSPYFIDERLLSSQSYYNNPFVNKKDYAASLKAPYKYKLDALDYIKKYFSSDNILLGHLLTGGSVALKKAVITYRADDIITLFVICHFIVEIIIEYLLIFVQDIHDIASYMHREVQDGGIAEEKAYIPTTVQEAILHLGIDSDDIGVYSHEELDYLSVANNVRIDNVDESYKRKWTQLQKTFIKIFKIGPSKMISKMDAGFFKKYYGRIPHLYREYGGRAEVVENRMANDPTEVLSNEVVKYVERMTEESTSLFISLLQIARRLSSVGNIEEKINIMNSYCKEFKIDTNDPDNIKENIVRETCFRIATSILQDNTIYGFTVDGILQNKKFPPANHIITSLFIKNPHEKPITQNVTDIFNSDKSLLLFANPKDILKFSNIYRQSSSKIIDTFNPKMAGMTEKNLHKASVRFSKLIQNDNTSDLNAKQSVDPKVQKKLSKEIDKAVLESIDMAIAQKRRCLQCAGVAHDMIKRVTDLAKRCIASMLMVEKSLTDRGNASTAKYKTGLRAQKNRGLEKTLKANQAHIEERPASRNTSNRSSYSDY